MTPEEAQKFYDQLVAEATHIGWSLDLIEIQKFLDSVADRYNLNHVTIEY